MIYKQQIVFMAFCSIIFSSCGLMDRHDLKTYLDGVDIHLENDYKILELKQVGLTDVTLNTKLIVSDKDKVKIIKALKRQFRFSIVDTVHSNPTHTKWGEDYVTGFISKSVYEFEKMDFNGQGHYQNYKVKLDTLTNELNFEWGDE